VVGTDRGVARVVGGPFREVTETENATPVPFLCLFEDREGNLWAGGSHGLTRFRDDSFTVFGRTRGCPATSQCCLPGPQRPHLGRIRRPRPGRMERRKAVPVAPLSDVNDRVYAIRETLGELLISDAMV